MPIRCLVDAPMMKIDLLSFNSYNKVVLFGLISCKRRKNGELENEDYVVFSNKTKNKTNKTQSMTHQL
jgi:hypothetical protein